MRLWNIAAGGKPALLLGPLAVDTAMQSEGVGANLMQLAIARARDLGHGGIILVGDPEYYARFGFSAAPTGGLVMPAPVERRRFLGLELASHGLSDAEGIIVPAGEKIAEAMRIPA
jgi:predicted N-acetyltransferase YhbS